MIRLYQKLFAVISVADDVGVSDDASQVIDVVAGAIDVLAMRPTALRRQLRDHMSRLRGHVKDADALALIDDVEKVLA